MVFAPTAGLAELSEAVGDVGVVDVDIVEPLAGMLLPDDVMLEPVALLLVIPLDCGLDCELSVEVEAVVVDG